jgi:hypothetical protein
MFRPDAADGNQHVKDKTELRPWHLEFVHLHELLEFQIGFVTAREYRRHAPDLALSESRCFQLSGRLHVGCHSSTAGPFTASSTLPRRIPARSPRISDPRGIFHHPRLPVGAPESRENLASAQPQYN